MIMTNSTRFSKDILNVCDFEEKKNISISLEKTISTLIPLQEDTASLERINSILNLRRSIRLEPEYQQDDGIYKQIAEESLDLLRKNQSTEDSNVLLQIFETSLSILGRPNFIDIASSTISQCKEYLLTHVNHQWFDGSMAETRGVQLSMNLLECVISLILQKQISSDVFEELANDSMHTLLLNLSTYSIHTVSSHALMCLLPQTMTFKYQPTLLEKLWSSIASQAGTTKGKMSGKRDSVTMLLCSIIEYFLPSETQTQESLIIHKNEFWQIIQCGIIHPDQAIRKQARYLLKRALDFVNNNKIIIKTDYFSWNQESTLEVWEQFFLVIESLEEKQVHLIKPMFPLVDNVFKTMEQQWSLCALHQVINHDNNFIVKWGLHFFMSLPPTNETKLFILYNLLPTLNSTLVFQTNSENISDISVGLSNMFHNIAADGDGEFFRKLLESLSCISWAPVPLYHISQALGNLPPVKAWCSEDLILLKKLLIEVLASHSIFLRAAAQSMILRCTLSLLNTDEVKLSSIADIFATLSKSECFTRGLRDWILTTEWLQKFMKPKEAEDFVASSLKYIVDNPETTDNVSALNCQAIARTIVLLCDANLVTAEVFTSLMQKLTIQLVECETRLYINQQSVDASLELLTCLADECIFNNNQNDTTQELILSIICSVSQGILSYLHSRLNAPLLLHDFHAVKIYTETLTMLASSPQIVACIVMQISTCMDTAIMILNNRNIESATQKLYAAKSIEWACSCISTYEEIFSNSYLQEKLESHIVDTVTSQSLNTNCPRPTGSVLTRDLQTLWGRITSDQLKARWSAFHILLQLPSSKLSDTLPYLDIRCQAVEGIEIGGPEILPPIMTTLNFFLYKEKDVDFIRNILNKCYSLSFAHRRTELFWPAIKGFIKLAFDRNMVARNDIAEDLSKFAAGLCEHSQVVTGLYNSVVQQVTTLLELTDNQITGLILKNGIVFGPVLRKDQRIDHFTCLYIESLGKEIPANTLLSSFCKVGQDVRALCVSLLLKSMKKNPGLIESVCRQLLTDEQTKTSHKIRYFADSYCHRVKHRTAQTLLLFESSLPESFCEELLKWACHSLEEESHQPSVRYILEWLAVRVLLHLPHLEQMFLDVMKQACEKRQGSMTSFISMLYLLVSGHAEQGQDVARLAELASQIILPWSMAQHYNLRLYSQVALLKIWSLCEKQDLAEVVARYSPLKSGLQLSLEQSSGVKNALRLQDDFYFSVFSPTKHFSLCTIFRELPRLSNISQDEWLPVSMFNCSATCPVPVRNPDLFMENCSVAPWILKSTGSGRVADEEEEEGSGSVVQRKMMPWKSMFPEQAARERKKEGSQGGLVVVASLVDRAPNLGGLSRTCEVLAVSQLILGNLKITEDQLFQSLSVSAEKWINLSEVRPEELPEYLLHMKRQGYTLVAAEQTSRSVPLQSMKFPKQTLLLLGNEKEGIPAELLPMLDVCVEVPQQGVVRSLNVHVTGAIFIWQYFQQHNL